jgi:hypothetical protein
MFVGRYSTSYLLVPCGFMPLEFHSSELTAMKWMRPASKDHHSYIADGKEGPQRLQ